ncbi:MAG: magnesium chelatase subunit H [Promethearchaeota archaeon]
MSSPPKIVLICYQFKPIMARTLRRLLDETNNAFEFLVMNTYDIDNGRVEPEYVRNVLLSSDIVLIDIRGGDLVTKIVVDTLSGTDKIIVCLIGGVEQLFKLTHLGSFSFAKFEKFKKIPLFSKLFKKKKAIDYGTILKMQERFKHLGEKFSFGLLRHAKNYVYLTEYYDNPLEENYYNFFLLLLKEYAGLRIPKEIKQPVRLPSMAIYAPKEHVTYQSLPEFLARYRYKDRRPRIGVLAYGGHHFDQTYPALAALTEFLEKHGAGVIPVICGDLRYYLAVEKFFIESGRPSVDVLIDLIWFRFAGGPLGGNHNETYRVIGKLGVPILHGILMSEKYWDDWENDARGISPTTTITSVILPELDGRFEPIVVVGPKKVHDDQFGWYQEFEASLNRIERLGFRALNWAKLRLKKNAEKKICIIIYDYPPGEENIGKCSYLDVFGSLARILEELKRVGYIIPRSDYSAEKLKQLILSSGLVNSGNWLQTQKVIEKLPKIPLSMYKEWLKEFPEAVRRRVLEAWGEPPGDIMTVENQIILPIIKLSPQILIGIQPSRGVHEDSSKAYHSKDLPPHHQYIAFYRWLEKVENVDAIVHLGTHGTLEFLPGKEVGLSSRCYPDLLLGNTPNIYIYHVVNASESSIAKRRSYAMIINHMSPPVAPSGIPDQLVEMERLLRQYYESAQINSTHAEKLAQSLIALGKKHGLGENVDEIHDRLAEYKRTLIPNGLHVFGVKLLEEEILNLLLYIARYDRGNMKGLLSILAERRGFCLQELIRNPSEKDPHGKFYSKILEEIESEAQNWIDDYVMNEKELNTKDSHFRANREFLLRIKFNIERSDEISALINVLDCRFIEPGPGGDMLRTPEVFPTGRSTYQLDPKNIPNEVALERGRIIAEEYVRRYFEIHKRYPQTVNLVLWAFETMKTGGETVAVAFKLLGVEPVWVSPYVREIRVIPLSELNRPRIDVFITICGIFRDTFYNIVELLDQAISKVAELDEPEEMNFIKANNARIGDVGAAGQQKTYRIFGPPEGSYATDLTTLIETSNWKSEQELVQEYINSMRYAYGRTYRNASAQDVFEALAKSVDVVSQVRDSVDYEIIDLDHYYEFLGGVARTVRELKGKDPAIYIADTTREFVKVETGKEAIKRGILTRLTNSKWLDGMLGHDFNGVEKIATRVENMLGLAATLNEIDDSDWDMVAEAVVFDEERYNKMLNANKWAVQKIIRKMLEANVRGYWKTDPDRIDKLKQKYLQLDLDLEKNSGL